MSDSKLLEAEIEDLKDRRLAVAWEWLVWFCGESDDDHAPERPVREGRPPWVE